MTTFMGGGAQKIVRMRERGFIFHVAGLLVNDDTTMTNCGVCMRTRDLYDT